MELAELPSTLVSPEQAAELVRQELLIVVALVTIFYSLGRS